jgi:hypothetical protein
MTEPHSTSDPHHQHQPPSAQKHPLHRVCIQCNNMFRVTRENLDAKQCPNCHKG